MIPEVGAFGKPPLYEHAGELALDDAGEALAHAVELPKDGEALVDERLGGQPRSYRYSA